MTRRILCVGFSSDPTFKYSVSAFQRFSEHPPMVVDLCEARNGFWAHYDEGGTECSVGTAGIRLSVRFDEVSLYQRVMPVSHLFRSRTRAWRGFRIAQYFFERLLDERRFPVVVNPWIGGWSNSTRPIHYRFLSRIGFQVPSWIVSNDPDTVRQFIADYGGGVFVKSVSGERTISSRFSKEHARDLASLPNSPVLFQQAISGSDVRIHVLGSECFGVRISSEAEDYRYPGDHPVVFVPEEVPPAIARLCVQATKELGLVISGIDFKICERTGRWYCLEANPSPGYSHYDLHLGGRIASALLRYLERPGTNVTKSPRIANALADT